MARKLDDWIKGFLEATAGLNSPHVFRLWAGIATVGAALQRRCYTHVMKRDMYPNLFILFVSDAGIGKSSAIIAGYDILRNIKEIKLASTRITSAAYWDELKEAAISKLNIETATMTTHHSLQAFIPEFSTFIRRGDIDFMADIADMYDCPDPAIYRTKHQGYHTIDKSWFAFVGGCTPVHIKNTFTEEALEGGFPARIIMVHSDEKVKVDLFGSARTDEHLNFMGDLKHDLMEILKLDGEFIWTKAAADYLVDWRERGLRPYPMDPRLKHYNTRRIMHIIKLTMILSASRRDTMRLEEEDVKAAQAILLTAERTMHKAISSIGANPYFAAMEQAVKLVTIEHERTGKGCPEYLIRQALDRDMPPNLIDQTIQTLVAARRLVKTGQGVDAFYLPVKGGGSDRRGAASTDGEKVESSTPLKKTESD